MKYNLLNLLLENVNDHIHKQEQQIVMVAECIKPRVAKIGYALKKKNFTVILFIKKESKAELDKSVLKYFDRIYFFTGKNEIYQKCLMLKPLVYHIFAEANVSEWAEYLIKNKERLGKMVYDQYDVYRGLVAEKEDDVSRREKFCLENADGLCCRMFETQYLKRRYGYRFQGKRILFLDYCWNRYQYKDDREGSRHMRFVYGGRLIPFSCSDRYKIELKGFRYITKMVEANNDYFVIVPSVSCREEGFRGYRNLSKANRNLIIKEPMNFYRLIRYESHMDYGIDCVELKGEMDKQQETEEIADLAGKNRYYATNKYFDYLDAGIMPIYGREGEMFGHYLGKYGGAVHCTLEELPERMEELRRKKAENRERAVKAREIFAIENQIDRLICFYKEIQGE